jgi:L-ribulose-5-phosphate 3-epimerase
MPRIGIMQGRLVPPEAGRLQCFPREQWRSEFPLAAAAGLDSIEWIYDEFGEDVNPLASDAGILEMKNLSEQHRVGVCSVCADYFMERPLLQANADERSLAVERLVWLLERCRLAGIQRVVLPFVDQSRIANPGDVSRVVDVLTAVSPEAERTSVELHLETALPPGPFAALLNRVPYACVRVTYDSGNSASLGYRPNEEFASYGRRIGSVHVKDRLTGGGSVPLGEGDADLRTVFDELNRVGYAGDYVLQAARGAPSSELTLARHNRAFVADELRRSALRGKAG